jgi:hypothetical protein
VELGDVTVREKHRRFFGGKKALEETSEKVSERGLDKTA